jgi:hypothetical protein
MNDTGYLLAVELVQDSPCVLVRRFQFLRKFLVRHRFVSDEFDGLAVLARKEGDSRFGQCFVVGHVNSY